jgi:hypothetical protein
MEKFIELQQEVIYFVFILYPVFFLSFFSLALVYVYLIPSLLLQNSELSYILIRQVAQF